LSASKRKLERSLRRAAASLETQFGPTRWRELSIAEASGGDPCAWGEFTVAEASKGAIMPRNGCARNPPASRRNALMVKLCQLRLARQGVRQPHTGSRMTPWRISARCRQPCRLSPTEPFGSRARAFHRSRTH
jgi:hypothetical protein